MEKQLIYSKMASIMKETKAIGKTEQNRQQEQQAAMERQRS